MFWTIVRKTFPFNDELKYLKISDIIIHIYDHFQYKINLVQIFFLFRSLFFYGRLNEFKSIELKWWMRKMQDNPVYLVND